MIFTTLFLLGSNLSVLPIYGHASPVTYIPKPNEIIDLAKDSLPEAVTITFTEAPEPRASGLKVINSNNERVDNDDLKVSESDDSISVSLNDSKIIPGVYTTDWLVLSKDDGHITKGTYVFSVKENISSISGSLSNEQNLTQGLQSYGDTTMGYSKNITTKDDVVLKFDIMPFKVGQNTFNLSAFYTNGSPVENIRNIYLQFDNTVKDLGPIFTIMERSSAGNYTSTGAFLSQPGTWEIKITVQRIGEYDINQEFKLNLKS
jgi:methionine-rich copper-binding protein CopC